MNRQIKELSEIADGLSLAEFNDISLRKFRLYREIYDEKFAELIIQECITEVSQYHSTTIYDGFIPENPTRKHYEEWAYIKGTNAGYNDAVNQIVYGLKEHFGVK